MPEGFGVEYDPPSGCIVMWDGPLSEIPSGWVLCDGNNGTPNLLDRFVRGAPSGADPGSTGGEHTKSLSTSQLSSHNHSPTMSSAGDHSHTYRFYDNGNAGDGTETVVGSSGSADGYTSTDGAHSHTMTIDSTGGGGSYDNRPPYYEIAFIMKS